MNKTIDYSIKNEGILHALREKWRNGFQAEKERWYNGGAGWMAKYVSTTFKLNGIEYEISPEDIGLSHSGWDQALMETLQDNIERDLESVGATDIHSFGMLD